MAELPTKDELEQLYHEKGRDALIWYAWRCALRMLPTLGQLPTSDVWKKDSVSHIYIIV